VVISENGINGKTEKSKLEIGVDIDGMWGMVQSAGRWTGKLSGERVNA